MKVRIVTLGCKLNFAESSALMNTLLSRGYERAKDGEEADVVIVNTCTVTDTADHKDRQAIHRLRRENPNARLIVTGCYARLKPQEITQMVEVDHVVQKPLERFVPARSKDDRTRCFLKVQDGCNYFCTYCTIPMARGRSRNAPISEVVQQARLALQEGAKEIVLTGVNIGDFGRSTNEQFIDLVKALDDITVYDTDNNIINYRIRISSCEPNLLLDDIIRFVASSEHFAPHFHIPLQSGSDEMLRIMHRHYDTALFAERIHTIRQLMPHAFIGVDCMVGVRGETEQRWNEYLRFVEGLEVSQLHVFTYSERANTRMLTMPLEVVSQQERDRRSHILHKVSENKLRQFYLKHQGEQRWVLWESRNNRGQMFGFSDNYIKVSRPFSQDKVNTFELVAL